MNVPFSAPRRNWPSLLLNLAVLVVVLAMAAATFVLSYSGVHAIVLQAGVSPRLARIYPGLFDAVFVIACVAAVRLRDARWWARWYAWLVIILMVVVVGAADVVYAINVTLRHRTIEGVVAAAPWVLLLLAFSLMLTMLRQSRVQQAPATALAEPTGQPSRRTWLPARRNCPRPHRSRKRTPCRSASGYRRTSRNLTASRHRKAPACRRTRTCRRTRPPSRKSRPLRPASTLPSPTSRRHPSRRRRTPMPGTPSRTWTPPVRPVPLSPSRRSRLWPPRRTRRPRGSPNRLRSRPQNLAAEPVAAGNGGGAAPYAAYQEDVAPTTPYNYWDSGADSGFHEPDRVPTLPGEVIDEDAPPFATAPFAAMPRFNRVRSTPMPPEGDDEEE